jgi:tRNA (Thr-GGU) A37 N-methylase
VELAVRPVAVVRNCRTEAIDNQWNSITSTIELLDDVPVASLTGLETFSHIEILFLADRASDVPPAPWSRRPRGNPEWPEVGIFAQRNKDRPNRLLSSIATIVAVSERTVTVTGLDAIDGTPVLDIKPVFSWSGPQGLLVTPQWSDDLGERYF